MRILKFLATKFLFLLSAFFSGCSQHPVSDAIATVLFIAASPLLIVQECLLDDYEKDFSHCHPELIGRKFRTLVDLPAFTGYPGEIIKKGTFSINSGICYQQNQDKIPNVRYIPAKTEFKIIKVIANSNVFGARMAYDKILAEIVKDGEIEEICVQSLFENQSIDVEPYRMFEPINSCIEEI